MDFSLQSQIISNVTNTVFIFGAGGHAQELTELALNHSRFVLHCDKRMVVYVTSSGTESEVQVLNTLLPNTNYNIISEDDFIKLTQFINPKDKVRVSEINTVIGVGSPSIKEKIYNKIVSLPGITFLNINGIVIFPNQVSAPKLEKFSGVVLGQNCTLTTNISLGKHVHLNTGSIVCHDVFIDDFSIVSPGAVICGNVKIGKRCYIGAGSVINDGVTLGDDITIGSGATVISNLTKPGIYVGTPAKFIKKGSL